MTQQLINNGAAPNDGTGDSPRDGMAKANANFTELYAAKDAQAAAIALKAPSANPTFTGTVSGITKAMVGLSQVDNTPDMSKPVSTAQQAAIDAGDKVRLSTGDLYNDFVTSGLVTPTGTGLTVTMSAGVAYVNGLRTTKTVGDTDLTYTYLATRDTYVDIDSNGIISRTAVVNGAARPALATGSLRLEKVVTDATKVASVVNLAPRVAKAVPVQIFTDSGGNTVLMGGNGKVYASLPVDSGGTLATIGDKSILTVGGDHPYKQWYGNDGTDGLARMYADLGIRPYCAICADESTDSTSGVGATLGKFGMMTASQAQSIEAQGVEFVSHGGRHTHFWELFNTGLRIYYSGAESTPTVNISSTTLTLHTAVTGDTALTLASYADISALKVAIEAVAGWNCLLATELVGTEPATALMPITAARSVATIGAGDPTNSNQRFALCAGLMIRYTGKAYRNISVSVNDGSNFLQLFADGARLLAQTTNTTLTAIATAVNALNISGLTCLVMDNGYAAQTVGGSSVLNPGQKIRETYCYGDESGLYLARVVQAQAVGGYGLNLCGGLGFQYVLRRAVESVIERAGSTYGVEIKSFAQPGGRFYPWHINGISNYHKNWRGDTSFAEQAYALSPYAEPAGKRSKFNGHFTSIIASSASNPYSEADVKAIIDALGDSAGWCVNWLNHLCTPTPGDPSPYTGLNQQTAGTYSSSADQDEGPFYRELVYAAAARDAGLIRIMPPSEAEANRFITREPDNLVFNYKFRNGRSGNLLNITTLAQGAFGVACPGHALSTSSSDWTAATVSNGQLTLTTNGALGANKTPIAWNVFLKPGETYDFGADFDLSALPIAASVRLSVQPMQGRMGDAFDENTFSFATPTMYGGIRELMQCRFTVPSASKPEPAYVRSIAGPFSFTAGDAVILNIDNRGNSAAIVLTGLTTAKAIAAAINTALESDATYANYGQYHNIASSENNRLILRVPTLTSSPGDTGSLITVSNSAGTPLVTLFGAGVSAVRATGQASSNYSTERVGYRITLVPSSTASTGTIKMRAPFCRKVQA